MKQIRPMKAAILAVTCSFLASLVGCSSLPISIGPAAATDSAPSPSAKAAAAQSQPHVRVEFHEPDEDPKIGILPLSDEPLFVSTALREVKARKRFSRFTAEVYRRGPQGYQRMAINLEAKGRVPAQYDYALHPGDRLIIARDSDTVLDDLLEPKSGPFRYLR